MQNSIWKLVSILGVIGIGGLVVVEVQNRLPNLPLAGQSQDESATTEDEATAESSGDQTSDAKLTLSEFEQRFAGEDASNRSFELNEPAVAANDSSRMAFGDDSSHSAAAFYGSGQGVTERSVPIDTNVRREQLASGGNPFEAFERSDSADAHAAPEPDSHIHTAAHADNDPVEFRVPAAATTVAVQPVGFSEEDPFGDDAVTTAANANTSESAEADPFSFDDDSATAEPQPSRQPDNAGIAAFSRDQDDHAVPIPRDVRTQTPPSARSAEESSPLLFFGDDERDAPIGNNPPNTGSGRTNFSDDQDPRSLSDSDPESDNPFGGFDAGDTDTDNRRSIPVPAETEPDLEPSPFDFDAEPTPVQPSRTTPHGNGSERTPAPAARPAAADVPTNGFFGDDDDPPLAASPRGSNPQGGAFSDADDEDALPFAEDLASGETPDTIDFGSPRRNNDSPLTIPELGSGAGNLRSTPPPSGTRSAPDFDDADPFDDADSRDFRFDDRGAAPRNPAAPRNAAPFESETPNGSAGQPASRTPAGGLSDFNTRPVISDPAVRPVSAVMRPHLTVRKNAPENATVGVPVPYTIVVRNEGQSVAYDVVVEDELPAAATLEGTRPNAEFDQRTRKMSWSFESLPPNEERELQVTIVPTGEGTLDGVATVQFKAQVKATTVIRAPKLELQMTGPAEVRIGDKVDYHYVITNRGSGEARDVYVRTVLPPSLRHPEGGDLEYEIPLMRPDEQREIVLSVVAADPGQYRTVAEATALGGAKAQAVSPVTVIGKQLQLERRGASRRFVGRPATYENVIQNETTFDAFDAEVIEQIPDGMKFVSASDNGLYNPQDRTVVWKIAELKAGKQKLLQIELAPLMAGEQRSVVTVIENAGFRSQADQITSVQDLHNVSADISRLDGPMAIGETFGFSISIDNRGTADATDVELIVQVPPEIKIVGAGSPDKPAFPGQNNSARFETVVRIPPGQQESFELRLQGQRPVQNGAVKAMVRYKQMQEPLVVSESVTVYSDR
ncbi:MAG: hypothetical protein R3C19_08270 [Planctomycetaceae bacterium]